jgi:hypothetical protein
VYFMSARLETPHIRGIYSPFSSKGSGPQPLGHPAALKIWLTPVIVTRGRDLAPSLFCELYVSRTRTSAYSAYI